MLVYGDHEEKADPRQLARAINHELEALRSAAGLERHARLVGVLIKAGQLLQGVADAAFADAQQDRRKDATDELTTFLADLGRAVCRSWDTGFGDYGDLPSLRLGAALPDEVTLKLPEGFAFYALYPEAYIDAARRLELSAPPCVIGIRSIGTALAPVVAAAVAAPAPVTVRPFGDPCARQIALEAELERELLERKAHYVIVDEGPGLSGSSFAAVADWLLERGVASDRIAVLPSHAGPPGAAATPARRAWWATVQRQVGDFEGGWPLLVERWCAATVGVADGPVEEVSAGAWRQRRYEAEADWPPVIASWERRKFLVSIGGERLLLKFAGLSAIGEEKFQVARALHSEGLVAEPLGLMHGFFVERWCDDARPLAKEERPLREIAHYIGTRAKLFPVASGSGASVGKLIEMARRNVSIEFGDAAATCLEKWKTRAHELDRAIVRVRTDNKLDRHEWLRTESGELIKADALDHHQAHDLIGCQDMAWDVAGAMIEFDVGQVDHDCFVEWVQHDSGRTIDRELLRFYRIAYLAFRLGQARLGATMVPDAAERRRISSAGDRYAALLGHLLQPTSAATRPNSLVD